MAAVTWALSADFDRNGSYEFDLRSYVDKAATVRISRGIDSSGKMRVSTFNVSLDNASGIFTPEYAASALYGLMTPDVPSSYQPPSSPCPTHSGRATRTHGRRRGPDLRG